MRLLLAVALFFAVALSAAPVKKKPPAKKASGAHRSTSKAGSRTKSKSRAPVSRKPTMQAGPSSDRYKEIQDALAAKGYLKTPATGVWDQDSQEAMRRFQADQKLDVTGKLSARTLISLGLGPKQ